MPEKTGLRRISSMSTYQHVNMTGSNNSDLTIRPITSSEHPVLEIFLYEAIFLPPGVEAPPRDIIYKPEVYIYVKDFGEKPDDIGFVAERSDTIIGAAWARIIPAFGHIDENTPELAMSVFPEHRGKGVGTILLSGLLDELKRLGYSQTSLAVQQKNDAVRFYKRLGYKVVNKNDEEYIMVKTLG
jgi:GNAT superfamily N-acetyltransferase